MRTLRWFTFLGWLILGGYMTSALSQPCPDSGSAVGEDHLTFSNNDTLTGEILSIDNHSIAFVSRTLGKLNVPWTAIRSIEIRDRVVFSESAGLPENPIKFKTVRIERVQDAVALRLDDQNPRLLSGVLRFGDLDCLEIPVAIAQPPQQGQAGTSWVLNIKAPASLAFGTASQETFGGIASLNIYSGRVGQVPRYHSELAATGSHNRSWQIGSPFVVTDTMDAFFKQSRSFGAAHGGIYGIAETFLNTSLGLAAQDSFGAGYYSPSRNLGPLQFNWQADLRYFRERLYASSESFDLAGSRFEGQLIYRKQDPQDKSKTKYLVILKSWINPMWNNEQALQAYGSLTLSLPLGRSVCIGFTPIEDDYLRNSPPGSRKNYATSSINLAIEHGSNPKQRCY